MKVSDQWQILDSPQLKWAGQIDFNSPRRFRLSSKIGTIDKPFLPLENYGVCGERNKFHSLLQKLQIIKKWTKNPTTFFGYPHRIFLLKPKNPDSSPPHLSPQQNLDWIYPCGWDIGIDSEDISPNEFSFSTYRSKTLIRSIVLRMQTFEFCHQYKRMAKAQKKHKTGKIESAVSKKIQW